MILSVFTASDQSPAPFWLHLNHVFPLLDSNSKFSHLMYVQVFCSYELHDSVMYNLLLCYLV